MNAFVRPACLFLLIIGVTRSADAQIIGASKVLRNANGENVAYSGIGRLSASSTCTAFLIRTSTNATDETPAYILTSGHCLPDRGANTVVVNKPLTDAEVTFHFFRDTQDRQLKVPAVAAVYSTMKGYDLAIIQLGVTFTELRGAGVQPLELAAEPSLDEEPVKVIGAPVVDIPREDAFLRESARNLGSPRPLIEFIWNFRQGLPNQCSDMKGGSSGSPVISQRTGAVVSIINTTNAGAVTVDGDFPCYLNQPCEVIAGKVQYQPDTNYALPVNELNSCFNESGMFQLNRPGCPLDPGRQLELSAPARAQQVPARWDVKLSGDVYTHYRYKSISEASGGDCRDPNGYGAVAALAEKPVIDAELPREVGRYYLCVLGGNSSTVDESWQPARFASMVHTRIDDTKPTIPITYQLEDTPSTYVLNPYFVLPELVSFQYKADTAGESTCQNPEGYRPYIRIPVRIPKDSGTNRICLYGEDEAGNRTNTLELSLRGASIRPDGIVNAASLQPVLLSGETILTVLGVNLGAEEVTAPTSGPVPGLGGVTAELTDASGQRIMLAMYYVGRDQINALLPERVSPGPAQLTLLGPNGSTTASLSIGERHPGLFTASGSGFGAPAGTAIRTSGGTTAEEPLFECGSPASCFARSVQLPGRDERLTFVLPVTGIAGTVAADIDLRLGGVRIPVQSVSAGPADGVQTISASIGPDFALRGYLPLTIKIADRTSNRLFVLLR